MKAILSALLSGAMLTIGAQEPETTVRAAIVGDLPDGTSVPLPPKPAFIVSQSDILESKVLTEGNREITVNKIVPIVLPPTSPVRESMEGNLEGQGDVANHDDDTAVADSGLLMVSATVYRSPGGSTRTLVQLSDPGPGESVTFWSSADFALLSGFASFIGSDGITRTIIMSWSQQSGPPPADEEEVSGLPAFPEGPASFSITSANPRAELLASARALHELYNNEHDRLLAAFQGRENSRIQQEAEFQANPPQPKNLTFGHWRIGGNIPAEGGGQ